MLSFNPRSCLTYVFARSATASATSGRCAHFTIGPLRVLLLDVRVKRRIAQVSFRAVAALEISTLDVVFRASLALAPSLILLAVVVATVVAVAAPVRLLLAIAPAPSVIHHLELGLGVGVHWGAYHMGWDAGIHGSARQHHIHVVVSHLAELLIGGVVARPSPVGRLLVHAWVLLLTRLLHHALAVRGAAHHAPEARPSIALLAHIVAAVAIGLPSRPVLLLLILIACHLI